MSETKDAPAPGGAAPARATRVAPEAKAPAEAYDTQATTTGAVDTVQLVPVRVQEEKEEFYRCYFCHRAPTPDEKKEGRCLSCKVPLERKKTPWTPKRIILTVVITSLVLLLVLGLTVGIYAGATIQARKMPVWPDTHWCEEGAKTDCQVYALSKWEQWSEWGNTCGQQKRTAERKVWAQGECCPAIEMTESRTGPACCAGESQSPPNSLGSKYCFRKLEAAAFDDAVTSCETMGGGLAVPTNESEAEWFQEILGQGVMYWIGVEASRAGEDVKFEFFDPEKTTGDSVFGFGLWDYGTQPDPEAAKPNPVFVTKAERLVMLPYQTCVANPDRKRCDERKDMVVWHANKNRHEQLVSICKLLPKDEVQENQQP